MTGHVAALVLAHDRALALYEDPQARRRRSQIVMLVLMVCFTCLGLWLLSAANCVMPVVLAHAGHWLVSLAYIAPLVFLVGVIVVGKIRDRRAGPATAPE